MLWQQGKAYKEAAGTRFWRLWLSVAKDRCQRAGGQCPPYAPEIKAFNDSKRPVPVLFISAVDLWQLCLGVGLGGDVGRTVDAHGNFLGLL